MTLNERDRWVVSIPTFTFHTIVSGLKLHFTYKLSQFFIVYLGMVIYKERRVEKISWTDHVRNEDVLRRLKEQRNILLEISKRKAKLIGHILRRNCLLQQVIEGKIKGGIKVIGSRGRRRRNLLDDLKERRGYSHLKEKALDRTKWIERFGRGFGPVVRQTACTK